VENKTNVQFVKAATESYISESNKAIGLDHAESESYTSFETIQKRGNPPFVAQMTCVSPLEKRRRIPAVAPAVLFVLLCTNSAMIPFSPRYSAIFSQVAFVKQKHTHLGLPLSLF
jgi:hypothetical protein